MAPGSTHHDNKGRQWLKQIILLTRLETYNARLNRGSTSSASHVQSKDAERRATAAPSDLSYMSGFGVWHDVYSDEWDCVPRAGFGYEDWEALGSDGSVVSPDGPDPDYGFHNYGYGGGHESSDGGSESSGYSTESNSESDSDSESESESESDSDSESESGSDSDAGPGPVAGAGTSSGSRGTASGMMVEGCKAPTTVPRIALHKGTEQVRVRHYRTRDVAKYREYQRAQREKRAAKEAKKAAKAEKMARKLAKEEKKEREREARRRAKEAWCMVVERVRVEEERNEAMECLEQWRVLQAQEELQMQELNELCSRGRHTGSFQSVHSLEDIDCCPL